MPQRYMWGHLQIGDRPNKLRSVGVPDFWCRGSYVVDRQVDDRRLAHALVEKDGAAIGKFRERFRERLQSVYGKLATEAGVEAKKLGLDDVLGPTSKAVARGYLKLREKERTSLRSYVGKLHLADLFLACACLERYEWAWDRLQRLVEEEVVPQLQRRCNTPLARSVLQEVKCQLATHCFDRLRKGDRQGLPRLATFDGSGPLVGWLHTVGWRLLQDHLPDGKMAAVPTADEFADRSPAPNDLAIARESEQLGQQYRRRLIDMLRATLVAMQGRRRMAAGLRWICRHRPAEVADIMRVSRPRVTELLREARNEFREATQSTCAEIAAETGRSADEILGILEDALEDLLGNDEDYPRGDGDATGDNARVVGGERTLPLSNGLEDKTR